MEERIPNINAAIIDERKITEYLLNPDHPEGRGKALFFLSKGFSVLQIEDFRQMLILQAKTNSVSKMQKTEWGTKYIVTGPVKWQQNVFTVTTVWIIENGEILPKLATAYPSLLL